MGQIIFTLLFYLMFIHYVNLGFYSLRLNSRSKLNRVFFALNMSIAIWTIGFAMANSTAIYNDALMWRRISSIGWGMQFSLQLHFVLVLTGKEKVMDKMWIKVLLYLPAMINIFIFGISNQLAVQQYDLFFTGFGWGNKAVNNAFDIYYYCYFILSELIVVGLLVRWYYKSKDKATKIQGILILFSFSFTFVIGSILEIFLNSFIKEGIPSFAPVLIIFPMSVIYYCIKTYGLLTDHEPIEEKEYVKILDDYDYKRFITYFYLLINVVGVVNLILVLYYGLSFPSGVIHSAIYVILSAIIGCLPYLWGNRKRQDNVLAFVLSITIMMTIVRFSYNFSSNIVWAGPLLFILITIVFNNNFMFILMGLTMIFSNILIWYLHPEVTIEVSFIDYVVRNVFYIAFSFIAIQIHNIYLGRIKSSEKKVMLQKMISDISSQFVSISESNYNTFMKTLIEKSAVFLKADISYFGMFSEDLTAYKIVHIWTENNRDGKSINSYKTETIYYPIFKEKLLNDEIVFVSSIDALSEEFTGEKDQLEDRGIESMLILPIKEKQKVIGFIGYEHRVSERNWEINDNGLLKLLSNIISDGRSKVKISKEIRELAYSDGLTGLPNRQKIEGIAKNELERAKINNKKLGVVFIDLDGFKDINDTLGHEWGDYVIKEVSSRLQKVMGEREEVGRFGGDEFLMIIPSFNNSDEFEKSIDNIMTVFNRSIKLNYQEFFLSASIGVAVYPEHGKSLSELVKNADIAMYKAKNNGKNQVAFYCEILDADIERRTYITNQLYRAIEREAMSINYQPKFMNNSNEIVGYRANLLWHNSDLGCILPNAFIPIAEQTGLIDEIGEWMIKKACDQLREWNCERKKPLTMTIQLSVGQLKNDVIVNSIKKSLSEANLKADLLEFEVTEDIAISDTASIIYILNELKRIGVKLAMNDFGIKYSSLGVLKELPIDGLMIHQNFVKGIGANKKDEAIIMTIVRLASKMGFEIIVDEIENQKQFEYIEKQLEVYNNWYYYKKEKYR